jgi:hypothetical protein
MGPFPKSLLSPGLALAALAASAEAANHQVGPSREYKRLQDVASRLEAGDTVFVDGDATYPGDVVFRRPGAPGNPIVIAGVAVDGKRPILSGGTNTVHFRSDEPWTSGADHYVFQGFEVTGGSSRCIFHQADGIVLRDLLVRDCPKQGILGADVGSGSLTLEFSEVRNCGGGNRDRDHQIYMSTDQVNRPGSVFRMRHNWVHDGDGGNNVKSRAERNEIHYNRIEGAWYHELELIGPDPFGVDGDWTPRMKREDSDVMGNVFRKLRTAAGNNADFAVFRVGGDATGETHGRYRFVNNTVIAGAGAVFRCFDSLESVEMHNNVFHRPGGSLNLTRVAEAYWTGGSPGFAGGNNWITAGASNVPSQWTGTLQGSDPGFVDLAAGDLRPAAGSPLVDAGRAAPPSPAAYPFPDPAWPPAYSAGVSGRPTAAPPRPVKGAVDIGAYEEGALASANPPLRAVRGPGGGISWQRADGTWRVRLTAADGSAEVRTLEGRLIERAP